MSSMTKESQEKLNKLNAVHPCGLFSLISAKQARAEQEQVGRYLPFFFELDADDVKP